MQKPDTTYQRILAYLKGLLSERQRHDLEKEMMRDTFAEEAFEGLSQLQGEELGADMDTLMERLDLRTTRGRRKFLTAYRIAAGLILFLGMGITLYVVLRRPVPELLTTTGKKDAPAETAVPQTPTTAMPADRKEVQPPPAATQEDAGQALQSVASDAPREEVPEMEFMEEEPAFVPQVQEKARSMADSRKEMAQPAPVMTKRSYIGKVVDSQGEPLPGAVVTIKGTSTGAVTDSEGNFTLPVPDSSAILQANFIGYKTAETKAREKTIVLHEDLMALEEVVVIGYGVQKKSDVTGAVSTIRLDETPLTDMAIVTKPVPPGGSLKEFKKWVNTQLDRNVINTYKGKQKTTVSLTIKQDGSLSNVQVKSVSDAVAQEFKRVIENSPLWSPALRDEVPVESTIEIRFTNSVDN
jgi:hypothetical protein